MVDVRWLTGNDVSGHYFVLNFKGVRFWGSFGSGGPLGMCGVRHCGSKVFSYDVEVGGNV